MIKITCDSTADLSAALYKRYDVQAIPLCITLGDFTGHDGRSVTQAEVFGYVEKTGKLPKTAAVPTIEYVECFSKYAEQGCEVVHINISAELSASHQNALAAAREVSGVHVVDSRSLSTGMGLLVLMAAELAKTGLSGEEVAEAVRAAAGRVEASFVVDTLEFLYKGGRCSALAQLGANLLQLKPCLNLIDGKICVGNKYRGKLARCLAEYVTDRLEGRTDISRSYIFITHTVSDMALVEGVRDQVAKLGRFNEIFITEAGCTISSHCGPGTLGILFLRE